MHKCGHFGPSVTLTRTHPRPPCCASCKLLLLVLLLLLAPAGPAQMPDAELFATRPKSSSENDCISLLPLAPVAHSFSVSVAANFSFGFSCELHSLVMLATSCSLPDCHQSRCTLQVAECRCGILPVVDSRPELQVLSFSYSCDQYY